MADFVVTAKAETRVLAHCDGSIPVTESPVVYFSAELLLAPPWPFTVDWDHYNTTGCVIVKIPSMQRIWQVTDLFDDHHNGYEGRWPD
jgi:hypothetical protein